MDALALYLWHLLSSRDESDSDEDEVELPHVKLPEITVLRKNEDVNATVGPYGMHRKRKRVSFAEPLHQNSSVTKNTDDSQSPGLLASHYTLVPVHTDHDYTPAPLVCYRQLPDGGQVRVAVEVKGVNRIEHYSRNEKPEYPKISSSQQKIAILREPTKKSEFTSLEFAKGDATFVHNKAYKPVREWDELLDQFDTKPEDGDKLFDQLITALSGKVEESGVELESESDDDDELVRSETFEDSNDYDGSDSVEIVWESSSQPAAKGNPVIQAKQSDREAEKHGYMELFDKFCEEVEPISVTTGDFQLDVSSVESGKAGVMKVLAEHPDNINEQLESSSIVISSTNSLFSKVENGDEHSDDSSAATDDDSSENSIDKSDSLAAQLESNLKRKDISSGQLGAMVKLLSSSDAESGADFQDSGPCSIQFEPDFKELCDWALSLSPTLAHPRPARKRKRSKKNTETNETETTGDQTQVNKRRPSKVTPIEKLSKSAMMARLAKEIRLSQDPRDMMADDHFKATFGVSKEFANFLITSLTPHLTQPRRSNMTPGHFKVLAALHFFTTGNKNWEVGRVAHISQPNVSKSLTEVIGTLILTAPEPELPTSDSEFGELYGLPDIIGAVDATHVPIKPPSGVGRKCKAKERFENPLLYKNSENLYSINVEIVSSSSNRVLFCCTKFPGSSTKSLMWHKSKVRDLMITRHLEENASDKLIAGSEYSSEPWILTPCSVTYSHSPEHRYNTALASALQDSTRLTIGLLKGRFKCLSMASSQQSLYYSPAKACQVITACCILHNLAMDFGEEMPDPIFDHFDLIETGADSNETNWDGLEARNSYILEHFC